MSDRKLFTLAQANQLVPQLEQMLGDLIALREEMANQAQGLNTMLQKASGNGGGAHANQYVINLQHFQALLDAIQAVGCEIKDLDSGLVDFPSLRDGRVVYLCWKRGEARIEYWHELDTGFGGRQPL